VTQVFQKVPLIQGVDLIDQVIRVTKFLGTNEVVAYIKQYKLTERKGHAKENICLDIIMAHKGGDMAIDEPSTFKEFVNDKNKDSCTAEVIDLLQKLLHLDYVHVW
jgi:casein kinase II subunit alpha